MKKARTKKNLTGLRKKGAPNLLLSEQHQGRPYKVVGFVVQPLIMLYNAEGEDDQEIPAQVKFTIRRSTFKRTPSEILIESGLLMESAK